MENTRRGKQPRYQYKTINEVIQCKNIQASYNIYGAVTEAVGPTKSKGSG